ncbi:hypothetical protein TNCV_4182521 [Trichonephila clavipes]|nr:hypothetical protein TNCV_4182521 [Trichonephila clavipes]
MFGRGLLNLALGAELKSLPALKKGETFRVSTSQSGNGRFRCSVAVEIQKRARFLAAYQWWEGGIFHSLDSCLLTLDWCSE